MSSPHDTGSAEEPPVVVRDRRRIDPHSGEVRVPAAANGPTGGGSAAGGHAAGGDGELLTLVESLNSAVQERTADLQRLKAEYDNYRRRVDRDRQLIAEQAAGRLIGALLPTLDDIGRARDHGDLEGPFKSVAESLEAALEGAGLTRYGAVGDEFDPVLHEALMHSYRDDVIAPTCVSVFRSGYSLGSRVLRVAQVAVAEPADEPAARADADGPANAEGGTDA